MSTYLKKKKVQTALQRAKELEQHQPMPKEKVVEIYKEGISFGEKIKNFLTPSWFVKDVDSSGNQIDKKEKIRTLNPPVKKEASAIKKKKIIAKAGTPTKKRKIKKRKKR